MQHRTTTQRPLHRGSASRPLFAVGAAAWAAADKHTLSVQVPISELIDGTPGASAGGINAAVGALRIAGHVVNTNGFATFVPKTHDPEKPGGGKGALFEAPSAGVATVGTGQLKPLQ